MAAPTHAPEPDPAACLRAQRRLSAQTEGPWLHGEVARRMAERLPFIKAQPSRVLQWGVVPDGSAEHLRQCYPRAEIQPVSTLPGIAPPRAPARRRWWSLASTRAAKAALDPDQAQEPPAELVWCNMLWHLIPSPARMVGQWHRALRPDGFLMFSTLGPDTLRDLRMLYAEAGWGLPHHPYEDMHDIGDRLVEAGFADPVMDQERLTLTFADPRALLAELRGLGGNCHPERAAGLRTPRWRERLCRALADRADGEGRIALGFEIVYGHAFRAPDRVRAAAQTTVDLERMRSMLRRGPAP